MTTAPSDGGAAAVQGDSPAVTASLTLTCRDCPKTWGPIPPSRVRRGIASADLDNRTYLCARCWNRRRMRKINRQRVKELTTVGYQERREEWLKKARRKAPPSATAPLAHGALRGRKPTPEFRVYRSLCWYARNLPKTALAFFFCEWCGKLTSRDPWDDRTLGAGCFEQASRSPQWGRYIVRQRDGDGLTKRPWAGQHQLHRTAQALKGDLLMLLEHYVLGMTLRQLGDKHFLTRGGVTDALARCKAILPPEWRHVFPTARGRDFKAAVIPTDLHSLRLKRSEPRYQL